MSLSLTKEKLEIEAKIRASIEAAWKDPSVKSYFDTRIKKEERQRELKQLENQRESLQDELDILYGSMLEKITTVQSALSKSDASDSVDNISRVTERFRSPPPSSYFSTFLSDMQEEWDQQRHQFTNALSQMSQSGSKAASHEIDKHLQNMQHQLEEKFQEKLLEWVEKKIKQSIDKKAASLKKLIEDPIEALTEKVVEHAKKADATEDLVLSSMYKTANFINKGSFEVSYWQKMSSLAKNFKQYVEDYNKIGSNPKNLQKLCLDVKKAIKDGDLDHASMLVENYFDNEQQKMTAAIDEMEKAIEGALEKDGEQLVEELLQNAEKELEKHNPLYKKMKSVEKTVKRADAVVDYFLSATSPSSSQVKEKPHPKSIAEKPDNKRKRRKD